MESYDRRSVAAIEEWAGVDVPFSYKTGTLTQNKLTLGDQFSVNAVTAGHVILSTALASRADNNDAIDTAVLPLFDPPREQARAAIETARQMGVNVKMVTGDQVAIAGELRMCADILDAGCFGDTKHHGTARLAESIEKARGGLHRADNARPVGDRRRDQGEPEKRAGKSSSG